MKTAETALALPLAQPLLNGQHYARAHVILLIGEAPVEVVVEGLDYKNGPTARLHLGAGSERLLIGLLGSDPFQGSFDIRVSWSAVASGPLTEDRLVDCRLRGTGYDPVPLSVLFVRHGPHPPGQPV